uniref:Uncharacterized protein n=1 Tax=Physcomitrium patens TaxID=3218 RepID=A0A2K1KEV4_PHYPA|nr:hypothetical protein PHYPA_008688 [Physcomitrium patens]
MVTSLPSRLQLRLLFCHRIRSRVPNLNHLQPKKHHKRGMRTNESLIKYHLWIRPSSLPSSEKTKNRLGCR